jgi:hypothetical protein
MRTDADLGQLMVELYARLRVYDRVHDEAWRRADMEHRDYDKALDATSRYTEPHRKQIGQLVRLILEEVTPDMTSDTSSASVPE